jgi:hypothetical protein
MPNKTTLQVGDRYQQGDWIWEIIEITADRMKARRAGRAIAVTQSSTNQLKQTQTATRPEIRQ